jgi:hypothetical protein
LELGTYTNQMRAGDGNEIEKRREMRKHA